MILTILGAGMVIGAVDALGFYKTAALYFSSKTPRRVPVAAALEIARLALLVGLFILVARFTHQWWIAVGAALLVSSVGKVTVIYRRLSA